MSPRPTIIMLCLVTDFLEISDTSAILYMVNIDSGACQALLARGAPWAWLQQLVAISEPIARMSMEYQFRFRYIESNNEDYEGTIVQILSVHRLTIVNWRRFVRRFELE